MNFVLTWFTEISNAVKDRIDCVNVSEHQYFKTVAPANEVYPEYVLFVRMVIPANIWSRIVAIGTKCMLFPEIFWYILINWSRVRTHTHTKMLFQNLFKLLFSFMDYHRFWFSAILCCSLYILGWKSEFFD